MSIETTIDIDEITALHDEGKELVITQDHEFEQVQVIRMTPDKAVALAAAIMSRLNA